MLKTIVCVVLGVLMATTSARAQQSALSRLDRADFRVLLVTPSAEAAINPERAIRALFAECVRPLRIFPGDTSKALAVRDWDTTRVASDELTLYVFPRAKQGAACGGDELRDQVAITRGLQFLEPAPFSASEDVQRVELRVADRLVSPNSTNRVPLSVLSNRSLRASAASAVRIRVPMATLEPLPTGRLDAIRLRVWMANAALAEDVEIPWSFVEPLWHHYLAERNEGLGGAPRLSGNGSSPASTVIAEFRAPADADLNAAYRAYRSGDFAAANWYILGRLGDPGLRWADERAARLQLAVSFASLGDSVASRIVFASLLQREPCLSLSGTAPPAARVVIAPITKPEARCRAVPLARVAMRSALLPGFGRPSNGAGGSFRRGFVSGVIGAALITGVSQNSRARSSYASYQASRSSAEAGQLFDQANAARSTARTGYAVAASVWGVSIVDALVREFRLMRRLEQVRDLAPAGGVGR